MTEEKGRYEVKTEPGVIRDSCFLPFDDGWTQPTAAEVKSMINLLGMSREEVSNYVGAGSGRSVRRWEAAEESDGHRKIPYSTWQILHWRLSRKQRYEGIVDLPAPAFTREECD